MHAYSPPSNLTTNNGSDLLSYKKTTLSCVMRHGPLQSDFNLQFCFVMFLYGYYFIHSFSITKTFYVYCIKHNCMKSVGFKIIYLSFHHSNFCQPPATRFLVICSRINLKMKVVRNTESTYRHNSLACTYNEERTSQLS